MYCNSVQVVAMQDVLLWFRNSGGVGIVVDLYILVM